MGLFGPDPAVMLRLARIEKKLDALLQAAGIRVDEAVDSDILDLARNGRKIEAIKLYRERTNCGLAEAKAFIDSL
jgi:ribosomal protein L7/L12